MKKVLFAIIVVVAIAAASCGQKKTVVEQNADSTVVKTEVVDSTLSIVPLL